MVFSAEGVYAGQVLRFELQRGERYVRWWSHTHDLSMSWHYVGRGAVIVVCPD